jgi:hypothetical protein
VSNVALGEYWRNSIAVAENDVPRAFRTRMAPEVKGTGAEPEAADCVCVWDCVGDKEKV